MHTQNIIFKFPIKHRYQYLWIIKISMPYGTKTIQLQGWIMWPSFISSSTKRQVFETLETDVTLLYNGECHVKTKWGISLLHLQHIKWETIQCFLLREQMQSLSDSSINALNHRHILAPRNFVSIVFMSTSFPTS